MKQWMREIHLTTGGKLFTGDKFDIDFTTSFSTSKDPDISEVVIYNLSEASIAAIKAKDFVILNAGYRGNVGNILNGAVEGIDVKWDKVNKLTTIKVSDGGVQWRYSSVQETYAAGTTATAILKDLVPLMGYGIGDLTVNKEVIYPLGKTISGDIEKAIKVLVKDTESKMYVDRGMMYIRAKDKGTDIGFLLKADTGLIDSPEKIEEEGEKNTVINKYNVKCLLNHRITTDSIIQIESRTANGSFRVESGSHKGVHNGEFVTELKVVPA